MGKNNYRQYDIDWIRIILILSVFFYHIALVFCGSGWLVKNEERVFWLDPAMDYLHVWRMPLLFLVSGVGTRFSSTKRTVGQYLNERFVRLGIPLIAGIVLLVPIQGYYHHIEKFSSIGDYYMFFFRKIITVGEYDLEHLWFILYLFVVSYLFIPIILFYKSSIYKKFELMVENFLRTPGAFLTLTVPILISQFVLLPFFPEQTMTLTNDWAYVALVMTYFLYGFVVIGNPKIVSVLVRDRYLYLLLATVTSIFYFFLDVSEPSRFELMIKHGNKTLMSWTICLTILGYARIYLNREHRWRKPLNQAIYPFYLMQQPIIVIVGYYVVQLSWSVDLKAIFLLICCLSIIAVFYVFFILPFNVMHVIFGLRLKTK